MITIEPLTVWEALSFIGMAKDGVPMSESRARKALREIGFKKSEMDQPYPKESMDELFDLVLHPEKLDQTVEEANEWMVTRN